MKEQLLRQSTLQNIYKNLPEDKELKTTKYVEDIKQAVKDVVDADDVVVTNVQEFVMEK